MASNFSSLRSSRKSLLSKLAEQAKSESAKGGGADERFWKLSVDAKTKIGYAVIRFLPAPKSEDLAWARLFSHAFQGPGGSWYIENCPTTLGQRSCPVCKENNKYWNSGVESDKDISRKRKRKLNYISNILVINDSSKPENNGKVFLYKYGVKIHEKIMELIEPQFPDQEPSNPFDLWEGSDFNLKSRDQGGFQNYDKSEFSAPSELFPGDDAAKETLWESQKALAEFTAESAFKSFEDLEKRYTAVLTGAGSPKTAEDAIREEANKDNDAIADVAEKIAKTADKAEKPVKASKPTKPAVKDSKPVKATKAPETPAEPETPEDDDIKAFFSSLED